VKTAASLAVLAILGGCASLDIWARPHLANQIETVLRHESASLPSTPSAVRFLAVCHASRCGDPPDALLQQLLLHGIEMRPVSDALITQSEREGATVLSKEFEPPGIVFSLSLGVWRYHSRCWHANVYGVSGLGEAFVYCLRRRGQAWEVESVSPPVVCSARSHFAAADGPLRFAPCPAAELTVR
jgi:hypothetical protein